MGRYATFSVFDYSEDNDLVRHVNSVGLSSRENINRIRPDSSGFVKYSEDDDLG